jgi:DNA polymerase I
MAPLFFDTYSLFFRAHYALPPMGTQAGEPTSALYGFVTLLLKLLREERPSGVAFALDPPGGSFRRDLFPGYKAGRPPTPEPIRRQRERLHTMLEALGAPRFVVPGFEADDVLATLAHETEEANVVVSGDRDLLQTVSAKTSVIFVGRRGEQHERYDEARVRARFGVSPAELASLIALMGDPSDALPRVPGVGQKTAAAWIRAYGDVAGLLAHLDAAEPARLRAPLRERAAQVALNETLARLRTDVPLGEGPRWAPVDSAALDRLRPIFAELEFVSLLARLDRE